MYFYYVVQKNIGLGTEIATIDREEMEDYADFERKLADWNGKDINFKYTPVKPASNSLLYIICVFCCEKLYELADCKETLRFLLQSSSKNVTKIQEAL